MTCRKSHEGLSGAMVKVSFVRLVALVMVLMAMMDRGPMMMSIHLG